MSPKTFAVELDYTFLTSDQELLAWAARSAAHKWLAFDTEFIGEKRFKTLVCLIQVANPDGLFLIDPIAIKSLQPFLSMIEDETVLKITHAGENDYRLLFQNYGTQPKNMVDTQLACGFLSDQYPVNFKRLVDEHLGISLKKGFAVVDWTKRPIQKDALNYALEDVVYLREMFDVVCGKLRRHDRYEWFMQEMSTWEDVSKFEKTVLDEVKQMSSVFKMRKAEKIFMFRMVAWRRALAEKRNHSREMVLATKDMNAVVRMMRNGPKAITNNRHLKNKSWVKYLDEWEQLYKQPASQEEKNALEELQTPVETDLRQEIVGEILYKYLSYHCLQKQISIDLVIPRSVMRDLRTGNQDSLNNLVTTWRGEFLGDDVLSILANTKDYEPVLEGSALHFKDLS